MTISGEFRGKYLSAHCLLMAEKLPEVKGPPPLKYQTWVLKVSIHCDGCKKMVKRVLQGIDGVYTTEIDSQANKVVVTGNVDANTLVRKLLKTGKHAELWAENNSGKSQKNKKNANTGEKTASDEHEENVGDIAANSDKNKESKKNEESANKQKTKDTVNQSSSGDLKGSENEKTSTVTVGGSGSEKKKKKSKGQKGNPKNNGGGNANDASQTPALVTPPAVSSAAPVAHTFPQHQVYSPSPYYPHPPVYTTSYNTLSSSAYMTPIFGDHTDSYLRKCVLAPPPECIDTHGDDLYDDDEVGCSIM